jgi:ParB-like chromosome segregation protein Spo0J
MAAKKSIRRNSSSESKEIISVSQSTDVCAFPLDRIQIATRNDSDLFFNPRSLDSFNPKEMSDLTDSIQNLGLIKPLAVRVWTNDDDQIVAAQIIAGERRLRAIHKLCEENRPCKDRRTKRIVPARELYAQATCHIYYDIDDVEALKIAWHENEHHRKLTTREEVELVERMLRNNMTQEQIVEFLDTNATWVSQTANFRNELPPAAFERLLSGQMTRNVAIHLLGLHPEDREAVFLQGIRVAEAESATKIKDLGSKQILAEDAALLLESDARDADERGDDVAAKKLRRRAGQVDSKAKEIKEKKKQAVSDKGRVSQGHIVVAQQALDVSPRRHAARKAKVVSTKQFFVDLPKTWLTMKEKVDPLTKKAYPKECISFLHSVGEAIIGGSDDPGQVIRDHLIDIGVWEAPVGYTKEAQQELQKTA